MPEQHISKQALAALKTQIDYICQHQLACKFDQIQRGIEKESLRITPAGRLSQQAHPKSLGAALTHPSITTDYSEALLEFITGVHFTIDDCLQELEDIHRFVYQKLDNEVLWVASMPCFIEQEKDIPIAEYGDSNIGQMKHIYRIGLEHRYTRLMQTIAGLHYNFSLSDDFWRAHQQASDDTQSLQAFKTQQYFHLIRNFQRHAWLLIYLFSASPAICPTFVRNREHQLQRFANGDLGQPHGMCLRMGDLGYQSNAQADLLVTYNDVDEYIATLLRALFKEHPEYVEIGLKDGSGFKQLNTHLLQIENEFYSIIRPKTITRSGEAPLMAIADRGVEYIEVRCLDLNPFLPLGIDAQQVRFLDAFLLFCLFAPSAELSPAEVQQTRNDFRAVVDAGLDPQLELSSGALGSSGVALLDQIEVFSQLLDETHQTTDYQQALAAQRAKLAMPERTPAAQVLNSIMPEGEPHQHFFHWALKQSQQTRDSLCEQPLDEQRQAWFEDLSAHSLADYAQHEQEKECDFELFLAEYYQQYQQLDAFKQL